MKKGNVEVKQIGRADEYKMFDIGRSIHSDGHYFRKQDLKDLHSILSELLETHKHKLESVGIGLQRCNCGKNLPDIISEFVETNTVKECCDYCIGGGDHLNCKCHKKKEEDISHTSPAIHCDECGKMHCPKCILNDASICESRKEEPTTPEKKCCEEVEICCSHNGNFTGETSEIDNYTGRKCVCTCHQEKLPTSSYEVTCGRCEKSIKHSCGKV